ncbi:MAG: ArnT family glycosyltransferase, partial [Candidatus Binatia bacterium]
MLQGALVFALAAVVYLGALGNDPFYSWREAREALVVQAELVSGEWILPLRNGVEIPTKPPLYYWLAGLVALARDGVDPFAMRLPSALLALAGIVAVFLRGGLAAGLVLATSLEWLRAGTSARVDMTQAAFLTGAFLAFEAATRAARPSARALVALYGCMALATL